LILQRQTKSKFMNNLKVWKCQSKFDKYVTQRIHHSRTVTHLKAWRELYQEVNDERYERGLAQKLFMKHWFKRLRVGAKLYKVSESKKGSL